MQKIKIDGFEEIKEMLRKYRECGALELKKYREIGTIEECREAMRKYKKEYNG